MAQVIETLKNMEDIEMNKVTFRLDGCRTHVTFLVLKLLNDSGFN